MEAIVPWEDVSSFAYVWGFWRSPAFFGLNNSVASLSVKNFMFWIIPPISNQEKTFKCLHRLFCAQ